MVPLWSDAREGVRVVRLLGPEDGERVEALVRLFKAVASEESWQPGNGLERGRHRSVYFALEVQGEIAGGLQLTLPDVQGRLPCFDLWPEAGFAAMRRAAHVAVLALAEPFRGQGLLVWRLAVEMWRHCVGEGIATLYLETTPRVLQLYRRLGWPLAVVGDLKQHWGEDCYLCTLGIAEVAEALLKKAEEGSPYYRQIIAQAFRVTLPATDGREARASSTIVREAAARYQTACFAAAP